LRYRLKASDSGWLDHPFLLPRSLRSWLTDQGSLTRRLKQCCSEFSVRPIRTGLSHASRDESKPLGIAHRHLAYVREVILNCDHQTVVFAHSVVAIKSLRGPWGGVTRLGTRPLGEVLFNNPRVRRGQLQYRRLTTHHPLARQARRSGICDIRQTLWARRSLFYLMGHPLMVTEVFLPKIGSVHHA
jgi:chorismate--pyruvate lyase